MRMNAMTRTVAGLVLLGCSWGASAYSCICDGPILSSIDTNTRATARATAQTAALLGTTNKLLTETITGINTLHRSTEKGSSMMHQSLEGLSAAQNEETARRALIDAKARTVDQIEKSVPANVCSVSESKERVGKSLRTQTASYQLINKGASSFNKSVRNSQDVMKRVEDQTPPKLTPEFVGSSAGTLTGQQLQDQFDYVVNVVNPTPPANPKNLPDQIKGKSEAKVYESVYDLWEAASKFYMKVAGRELEMKDATIAVDPSFPEVWKKINGTNSYEPPMVATPAGSKESAYPDHRMGIHVENGKVSELDFLRTQVYRRYALAEWSGEELTAMNTNALLKEIAEMMAIQNRMAYETMHLTQSMATMMAIRESRANDEKFNPQLSALLESMRTR